MTHKTVSAIALAMIITASSASAADPVTTRQDIMKSVGAATGTLGKMVKGEIPYDPISAELAVRLLFTAGVAFPTQFPEGSDAGDTEASPKIWENKAEFDKISADFAGAALAAIPASKNGLDSLKGSFGSIAKNCKACHQEFRAKKN